jgi:multifunctional beta-oxidation protein
MQPDYVAPVVGYLISDGKTTFNSQFNGFVLNVCLANEGTSGALFEITGGWAAQTRWQRSGGHGFPINKQLTPEDIASKWKIISNFGTFVLWRLLPPML